MVGYNTLLPGARLLMKLQVTRTNNNVIVRWAPGEGEGALRCVVEHAQSAAAAQVSQVCGLWSAALRRSPPPATAPVSSSSLLTRPPGALLQSVCVRECVCVV